jgi:undecaprenyl-diphosphatase
MHDLGIDTWIVLQLMSWTTAHPALVQIAIFLSSSLPNFMAAVLAVYLLVTLAHQGRLLWLVPVVMIGAWLCARGIQLAWFRERPFDAGIVVALLPHRESGSFPSTHATVVFAVGWLLWATREAFVLVWAWWTFAVLVCIGRVACGLHYPTDVLGGLLVGVVCASSSVALVRGRLWLERTQNNTEVDPPTAQKD